MNSIHLVFSVPPAHVSGEEFDAWYDPHLSEILSVRGFCKAQRYRRIPGTGEDGGPWQYLTLYELDEEVNVALASLQEAIDAGAMTLPDWIAATTFMSLSFEPHGRPVESSAG